MANSEAPDSVEYTTLVQCQQELITVLSKDILNKLAEAGLISQQLKTAEKNLMSASNLVRQVIEIIKTSSEKFDVFLGILSQFNWLKDVAKSIRECYQVNKASELSLALN